jgi:hypothetical protein
MCGNSIQLRVPSPDGEYEAVQFTRDCGATTGYSTQVSVVRKGAPVLERPSFWQATQSGNALVQGEHVLTGVQIRWDDATHVRIAVHSQAQATQVSGRVDAVTVIVERTPRVH